MVRRTIEARCASRESDLDRWMAAAQCELANGPVGSDEYRIVLLHDSEELWDIHSRKHGMPISFRDIDHRIGAGNLSRRQPLGRAIGSKAKTIIDATAGLGHDAALLACMGWHVFAIERDPFIASLLELAWEDAKRHPELWSLLDGHLRIQRGDAVTVLADQQADVVYLDPMYTDRRRRSSLPKKPAQVLQALASTSDESSLFEMAKQAARRVIVKRPAHGPPLHDGVDLTFEGRMVRYDVYLNPNQEDAI